MEDKGVDLSKPPPEPEPARVNRSVPRCFVLRESGLLRHTRELQWTAEDKMVMKTHEEFKCELPDISRSTFLMVFSPDGKKVASTHGNHNVYVTDLTSGKNVRTLSGHPRTPWCIAFHPSSNQILASGCLGGQVRVWDLTGGSEIWMAESQTVIASLAFHPVDRMLVIASYNELHFWDWSRPEPFAKRYTANEKEKVRYVAFDALGHKLITGVANAPPRAQTSQWDRVAAPQPPPPPATGQLDSERRITVCYRYMVEQYEQLVQRYCDLSRARNTLTMDRGTDPMEMEGEAGGSGGGGGSRRVLFSRGPPRPTSGTDEASASHSSTSFLSPPSSSDSPAPASAPQPPPLLAGTESTTPHDTPRRSPRFDITLPSFSNFRSRSSSASSLDPSGGSLEVPTFSVRLPQTPPPPPATAAVGHSSEDVDEETGSTVDRMLRDLMSDGTSTEMNSAVDSEHEEELLPMLSRHRRGTPGPAAHRNDAEATPAAVSQLSSQFHRLRASVYDNDSRPHSHHVFSAETQAAERRLLSRLHEILERPLPEPRVGAARSGSSRLMPSRRSAFQPRTPQAHASPSSPPTTDPPPADVIGGVRYGITLLSRHIDNMQRLCRARLEILQLQQIRRMWQDLQSQIYTLHGAVGGGGAAEAGGEPPTSTATASSSAATAAATATASSATTASAASSATADATNDLLTDDDSDGPSGNGEVHWRMRRTPQTSRRSAANKPPQPRNAANAKNPPMKRSRLMFRVCDSRRLSAMQMEASRRLLNRQASSSTQATSEASSSQAPSDTSTTTEGTTGSEDRRSSASVRGVKRKSTRGAADTDPLFRPRPPTATATTPNATAGSGNSTSNLAAVMRETIVQLENMLWRHRQGGGGAGGGGHSQRSSATRLSRFTRQREERMLRNLWDTESSHESSRDDQSEGDSSQQSSRNAAVDAGEPEWSRDSTRTRAREVLLLMVDSLTQFFESDTLSRRTTNEALNDRIHSLYVLLQLALNLTDLLLEQLVNSRRELEARRPGALDANTWSVNSPRNAMRNQRHARYMARTIGRTSLAWRRILRRAPPPTSPSTPSPPPERANPGRYSPESPAPSPSSAASGRGLGPYSNIRSAMMARFHHSQAVAAARGGTPVVPIVRVNDLPAPPPEDTPSPRLRPHSPPPHPVVVPPRFLHPGRYSAGGFVFDESTSEDSSPQEQRSNDYLFVRAPYTSSVLLTDTPMSPHHRIQAWDFSNYQLPDLADSHKNIVVGECKIHNDASVDISQNGQILVTLLPSGRLSMTTLLGVYSLNWRTLGQLLYTTSFEQSIVSVSLSPTNRHLVVGLASRRVTLVMADRHINAQIFRLEGASPGRKGPVGPRGRLMHLRDLELSRQPGFMSLNCIRWAPDPGQGLVYGTNTGHLKILR